MVVQILSRLPPKSLVRFRCVSKLWYSLMNDPSFVDNHLYNSTHNKFTSATCIVVKHTLLKDRSATDELDVAAFHKMFENNNIDLLLSFLNRCNDNDGDGDNLTFVVEELDDLFPSSIYPSTGIVSIVGHCDGILCVTDDTNIDILCNPAIREVRVVPESCVLNDLPPRAEDEDEYSAPWSDTTALGFGLDSKAKEYKIVRVVETTSGACTQHPTRAEVFTMGTNSWRELENVDLGCHVCWSTPSFAMHFKGTFYWFACDPSHKELILTFDMSDELFNRITLLNCVYDTDGRDRSLAVLKESIVLFTYELADEVSKSFDIWMLDESTGVKRFMDKILGLRTGGRHQNSNL